MTIGRYPAIGLSEARKLANQKIALASDGIDPKTERITRVFSRAKTVSDASAIYIKWCETNNAFRTFESKQSAFRVHIIPTLGRITLADLSRGQVAKLIDGIGDRPAMRKQLYTYLTHFFNWCAERDLIPSNPIRDLRPPKKTPARERVLTDAEIAALFDQDGIMATIAKLCLLTAQRKGSVEAMRWDDLDLDRAKWTIPGKDMKSGKLHVVPLSGTVIDLLDRWPRLKGPYVFGIRSDGNKPYAGSSNGMAGLRRALGNPDWRLHDLRRTAVTLAQRHGCKTEDIKAVTQHKPSGVIGIYARHGFEDEKKVVVEAIADEIASAIDTTNRSG